MSKKDEIEYLEAIRHSLMKDHLKGPPPIHRVVEICNLLLIKWIRELEEEIKESHD